MPKKRESSNPRTLIAVIIDESGSMDSRRDETIASVNDYLQGIEDENPDTRVTIVNFSSPIGEARRVRFVEQNKRVADTYELTKETYRPRGNTPLLDAVGKTISKIEEQDVDRFLVVVVTDGQENDSREFTQQRIKNIIRDKEDSGRWTFTYLGVGVDAWAGAQYLGYSHRGNTGSYDTVGQSFAMASAGTTEFLRSSKLSSDSFVEETEDVFSVDQILKVNS